MKTIVFIISSFAILATMAACSDDKKSEPVPDAGIDAGDTDTGEPDTDTESESDTGENETPPDLPEDCQAQVINAAASGDEDGRWPSLAWNGSAALMSWGYDAEPTTPHWQIQLATYDPGPDGGVGDPETPMTADVISKAPMLTARDSEFGALWLDSRWDGSCSADAQDDCQLDLAFMTFDSTGQPANATPKQVTFGAGIEDRPSLVATTSGYLAAWIEPDTSSVATVFAVALDADGDPGTPEQLSEAEGAATERLPALAVLDDVAVVVWLGASQNEVASRAIGLDGVPVDEVQLIDGDNLVNRPRIAAGADGFLVTWGRRVYEDFEIYSRLLDSDGNPSGTAQRVTYTPEDVMQSAPAWNGTEFAVMWLASMANGAEECVFDSCDAQVFATALDEYGAPRAVPVRLSDDPNRCDVPFLAWDGGGWTAIWELLRNLRMQITYGRMICD